MANGQDWSRVDQLLERALEQPVDEREAWLDETCGSDEALRSRLETLLQHAEQDDDDLLSPGGGLKGVIGKEIVESLEARNEPDLEPGSQLGPYEIRELVGVGGMGRVYRAHDPKLARDVAIKALSGALSTELESLRRFEREARVLAALNHPNIGGIHDLQVFDGTPYLILEFVEGDTLETFLAKRRPSRAEAVDIARQIAAALEGAHSRGIVHRDLKPGNVKLARDGGVKVLDFGLAARLQHPAAAEEVGAEGHRVTGEGTIVGTASYMSPEQARGEVVDERADLWALGCILYEMLTGDLAFDGSTISDILASVLRDEAELSRLPEATPLPLRRVLRRCLQKDLRRRLQHAGDLRIELEELEYEIEAATNDRATPPILPPRSRTAMPWLVAALAVGIALVVGLGRRPPNGGRASLSERRQFVLDLPSDEELPRGDYTSPVALSPEADSIVLLGSDDDGTRLYYRNLERLDWIELPGTTGAWQPFFSTDGREIGFFAQGKLMRTALDGSQPVPLAEVGGNPRGATWAPDDTIVFGPSHTSALAAVNARSGPTRPLTRLDDATSERSHRWPQILPDGKSVLFTVDFHDLTFDNASLAVASLETGEHHIVLEGGAYGRYVPGGHVLYSHAGRLFAAPFDARKAIVTGEPTVVLDSVFYDLRNGGTKLAVANEGTLAYVPGRGRSLERQLVWLGIEGLREPVVRQTGHYHDPILSPDRQRIALRIGDPESSDIWTLDLASGTLAQVTFGLQTVRPIWTPDSRALTVGVIDPEGYRLVTLDADGGEPLVDLRESSQRLYPGSWLADGRRLIFQERRADSGWDLFTLEVDSDGRPSSDPAPLVATAANETNPALSPDGSFLAYESDDSDGLVNIYVRPFDRPGARVEISTGGGRWPQWGDSGELYFWSSFTQQMRRVKQRIQDGRFLVEDSEILWSGETVPIVVSLSEFLGRGFDLDREGRRFLMLEARGQGSPPPSQVVIALHWADGLRQAAD